MYFPGPLEHQLLENECLYIFYYIEWSAIRFKNKGVIAISRKHVQ